MTSFIRRSLTLLSRLNIPVFLSNANFIYFQRCSFSHGRVCPARNRLIHTFEHASGISATKRRRLFQEIMEYDKFKRGLPKEQSDDLLKDINCYGCGVALQCFDHNIPGFIPFQSLQTLDTPADISRRIICWRCHLIHEEGLALKTSIKAEEYEHIISRIKSDAGAVLVLLDAADVSNSIFPNLGHLIGRHRQLYLLLNKVDLLPQLSIKQQSRLKETVAQIFQASVADKFLRQEVHLISAETGYGIEPLITSLLHNNYFSGNLFILGCTNVGKSSLFNRLINSDLCSERCRNYMQKATISNWPGTTLDLLKFPLRRVRSNFLSDRNFRLDKKHKVSSDNQAKVNIGVSRTLKEYESRALANLMDTYSPVSYQFDEKSGHFLKGKAKSDISLPQFREADFANDDWCYDSPGVVNKNQISNSLTQQELELVLPQGHVKVKQITLSPRQTIFVSALARVDYLEGSDDLQIYIVCSSRLRIHQVDSRFADWYFRKNFGKSLQVPTDKLATQVPSLVGKQIGLTCRGVGTIAGDVVLSSVGWIAVTGSNRNVVWLRAFTPGGAGCGLRQPGHFLPLTSLQKAAGGGSMGKQQWEASSSNSSSGRRAAAGKGKEGRASRAETQIRGG